MTDYAAVRSNMVESQLRTNKVTDPDLLDAFMQVPRERFLPENLQGIAYVDQDIPVGNGRFMMQPMVLARLLQAATISASDSVLDVGCGTGYCAAVLARLASTVVAVEADAGLADRAVATLTALVGTKVKVVNTPHEAGYSSRGPYDVIVLGGAVAVLPATLTDQLAIGGRLVAVIGAPGMVAQATLVERLDAGISRRVLFDAAIQPLPGFAQERAFVF
ncbi:MAG TPA: protein-L-isoaspartate O-methyltransferase [Stellaceae bacterium]|nr:protein-L-isoaspartate O-methyltransferase [Stellaceae bacterium]